MQGIFTGQNEIRYSYARYGYTRGGGKTWHGGLDIVGLDDTTVLMPYFHYDNGQTKSISGTVTQARRVTNKSNKTWEWGYYVCVKLDSNQTPDIVNYLYFCHNKELLVKVGDKVKSGDALAVMGNTGNAALASPPYAHVHFEVRSSSTGKGLDPTHYTGTENAVGIYGEKESEEPKTETKLQKITIGPVSNGDAMKVYQLCKELKLTDAGLYKSEYVEG